MFLLGTILLKPITHFCLFFSGHKMDLLGSIMSKMEKPPTTTTQAQRDAKKKQMEEVKKMKEREKDMLLKFRQQVCVHA